MTKKLGLQFNTKHSILKIIVIEYFLYHWNPIPFTKDNMIINASKLALMDVNVPV
jgi:hypothetical protein